MTSRPKRLAIAALVPFLALWVAAWFDGNVVNEAVVQAGHNYDYRAREPRCLCRLSGRDGWRTGHSGRGLVGP